jgi:hypothetical protein
MAGHFVVLAAFQVQAEPPTFAVPENSHPPFHGHLGADPGGEAVDMTADHRFGWRTPWARTACWQRVEADMAQ